MTLLHCPLKERSLSLCYPSRGLRVPSRNMNSIAIPLVKNDAFPMQSNVKSVYRRLKEISKVLRGIISCVINSINQSCNL